VMSEEASSSERCCPRRGVSFPRVQPRRGRSRRLGAVLGCLVGLFAGAAGCGKGASDTSGATPPSGSPTPGSPGAGGIIPQDRLTTWDPGIPGGIPARTTVCASLSASAFGNGNSDATPAIQAAIDECPPDQVVLLSAGTFRVEGEHPITIGKGIVLRGALNPRIRRLKQRGGPRKIGFHFGARNLKQWADDTDN